MSSWSHYVFAQSAKIGNPLAKALLILMSQDMHDRDYRIQAGSQHRLSSEIDRCSYYFELLELSPERGRKLIELLLRRGFLVFDYGLVTGAIEPAPKHEERAPPKLSPRKRRIFERDGWRCVYCGSADQLTIDHRRPRSRAGTDEDHNLATACSTCNTRKGAKLVSEWKGETWEYVL